MLKEAIIQYCTVGTRCTTRTVNVSWSIFTFFVLIHINIILGNIKGIYQPKQNKKVYISQEVIDGPLYTNVHGLFAAKARLSTKTAL